MTPSTGRPPVIDLSIEAEGWPDEPTLHRWFDKALGATCKALALDLQEAELAVVLTDDAAIRTINKQHRGKDQPTNVLSFPALAFSPDATAKQADLPPHPFLLGDLVFALNTVQREADVAGISLDHHMQHLIVHGFLHLLGFDHVLHDQAEAMETLETEVLAGLGVADPYR